MLKPQKRFISLAVAFAVAFALAAGFALIDVAAQRANRATAQRANRATASPGADNLISIGAARALPPGTVVTVEGTVSVPSGAFKSATDDQGFAIEDESGGIYVSTSPHLGLRGIQRVRVRGQLADKYGQLILVPADANDVKALGRAMTIRAKRISTGQVNEATEGRLVRVIGRITKPVENDLPHGYRVFIDDGSGEIQVFIHRSTGIRVRSLQPGLSISATGFSGQYEDHYEVMPRAPSDIHFSQ